MEAYNIRESLDEFSAAREQFEMIVGALQSDEMMAAEHGDVEQLLFKAGFELLRRLFQGHLDGRAAAEPLRESVKGSDGVERTHRRVGCTRTLELIFGEVTVRRVGYGYPGWESVFPLDAALNLPPGKYFHGLQTLLADEVAKGAFEEAVATLRRPAARCPNAKPRSWRLGSPRTSTRSTGRAGWGSPRRPTICW